MAAATGRWLVPDETLEHAAKLGKSPEIQTSLGLSLLGSKQTQEGLAQLREVVKQDPGQGRASMALALTALREQQPRRAAELMEEVIKREPDNLPALNVLGVARAAAGDFAAARKAYDKALSKDRGFDSVKLNLVKLDLAEGKPADARTRLVALLNRRVKGVHVDMDDLADGGVRAVTGVEVRVVVHGAALACCHDVLNDAHDAGLDEDGANWQSPPTLGERV